MEVKFIMKSNRSEQWGCHFITLLFEDERRSNAIVMNFNEV